MVTWDIIKFGRICLEFSILDWYNIFNKNYTQKLVIVRFPDKNCVPFDDAL
jgi:hypothetical protein